MGFIRLLATFIHIVIGLNRILIAFSQLFINITEQIASIQALDRSM